jgi:superfamily I DNA and RNA helicase
VRLTEVAVGVLLARGIALADIAVISFRGLGKSLFAQADTLGRHSVRRFTGKYSASGEALWTAGELLVDSVYRFKGQSAAGVVLTEMDFSELDEAAKRKLFVGMTRAQLGLEMVMSRAAEGAVAGVL